MDRKKKNRILKLITNKYFIASILFVTWLFFFDENSIVSHQKNKNLLKDLKQQKEKYSSQIELDKQKLEELNSGKKNLEKFAREEYFMSKEDEDVFVVIEKK